MPILKNTRVSVGMLMPGRLDVLWDFVNPIDSLRYEIWVERSGFFRGPFQLLAKTYNAFVFTDRTVQITVDKVHYYYRLRAVPRDNPVEASTVELTEPFLLEAPKDLISAEIQRRNNLLVQEYIGRSVFFFRRRHDGDRCPNCWSEGLRQQTLSKCEVCFDTGWVLGFYNPVVVSLNIQRDSIGLRQDAEVDEVFVRTADGFFGGNIDILINDMFIERENVRWVVVGMDDHKKLRSTVSQVFKLNMLPDTDILFRVPVPNSEILDTITPSREFSRPYTLVRPNADLRV